MVCMDNHSALSCFHPLVRDWFLRKYGGPTEVQAKAWPLIAKGNHLLVNAPTGSGKTLCGFLWGLNNLITGAWPIGRTSLLYVSPLKALNNDIRVNLIKPLKELEAVFTEAGAEFPLIRVKTRSGDTPQSERQKMIRRPPEIFITTPESLNLILSSVRSMEILESVKTVLLDEIHAVAPNKRGTHLMTAVERVTLLAGEFQRIGLTATAKPLSLLAAFVGGQRPMNIGPMKNGEHSHEKRKVRTVSVPGGKKYDIRVRIPWDGPDGAVTERGKSGSDGQGPEGGTGRGETDDTVFDRLARELVEIIGQNRSTLIFTNGRRTAERLTRLINAQAGDRLAYAHHGSLSREIRTLVENKLRQGELKAIVATSSLELGIDIGDLDEVVMVQTPFSVSSALQRAGRAGHTVGAVCRALVYPLFVKDIVSSGVAARLIVDGEIEDTYIPRCPLDVLAQVIIAMTGVQTWDRDDLFGFIRGCFSYRDLTRKSYDLVLEMLTGRYEKTRIRELKSRLVLDPATNTVKGREGVLRLVYMAGGTIPDRGYYGLRVQGSGDRIGDLDEEFVWERSVGDVFVFGTQSWRIVSIDHQNVEVVPAAWPAVFVPFWKAEYTGRSWYFSEKIARLMEEAAGIVRYGKDPALLAEYFIEGKTAESLIEYLEEQERRCGIIPHRHQILVEYLSSAGKASARAVVIHAPWGGRVLAPFGLALKQAWKERYGEEAGVYHDEDTVLIETGPNTVYPPARELMALVGPDTLMPLLLRSLGNTGIFGARFREGASTSLLLLRSGFKRRMPLWLNRLRSKRLLQSVGGLGDFPVTVEAWRACLKDDFDLDALLGVLGEVELGKIEVGHVYSESPSPFARSILHKQIHVRMYSDDKPEGIEVKKPGIDVVEEVLGSRDLRPLIPRALIRDFMRRLKRLDQGWVPGSAEDLFEWVKERVAIPEDEWEELIEAVREVYGGEASCWIEEMAGKACFVTLPDAGIPSVMSFETLVRILELLFIPEIDEEKGDSSLSVVVGEWLRYEGPVKPGRLEEVFGLKEPRLSEAVRLLASRGDIIFDVIQEGTGHRELCDVRVLEMMLRLKRRRARPSLKPLDVEFLPLFLACHQSIVRSGNGLENGLQVRNGQADVRIEQLKSCLDRLFGYPCAAELWEEEIFPVRVEGYEPALLDRLFRESGLIWFGCGREKTSFCLEEDRRLFLRGRGRRREPDDLFAGSAGKWGFEDLRSRLRIDGAELTEMLWKLAWNGVVSNDGYAAVREGVANGFGYTGKTGPPAGRYRPRASRWSRGPSGNWYLLDTDGELLDQLEEEELYRERARQLLMRYGVLFRELVSNELPVMSWFRLFRSLRIMELSGEVIGGRFFDGAGVRSGLQFASPEAYELLRNLPGDRIYRMNAADPASLCGVRLEGMELGLPRRIKTNHVVFHGVKPVLITRGRGSSLEFRTVGDDPHIGDYLEVLRETAERRAGSPGVVRVLKINGKDVHDSPFLKHLLEFGFSPTHNGVVLHGRYR